MATPWTTLFKWFGAQNFTWEQGVTFLILMLLISIILKFKEVKGIFKFIAGKRKRSCKDCAEILTSYTKRFELEQKRIHKEQDKIEDRVLQSQMKFAQQKLIELRLNLNTFFEKSLQKNNKDDIRNEIIQYRMFWGLIKDIIYNISDEIRRSFKENGFYDIKGNDFAIYVKDKNKTLISMLREYLKNMYPDSNKIIVPLREIINHVSDLTKDLEDIVFEIYIEAKRLNEECSNKVLVLDKEILTIRDEVFQEIDDFIKDR